MSNAGNEAYELENTSLLNCLRVKTDPSMGWPMDVLDIEIIWLAPLADDKMFVD